jgi:hypothetical protein
MNINKYQNSKIYKLVCNVTGDVYIGSTYKKTLARRLSGHLKNYKFYKKGCGTYTSSFEIIERGNYDIILVEEFPCETKDQLRKREREIIESVKCINLMNPYSSQQEKKKE